MFFQSKTEKFVIIGAGGAGREMYWHLVRFNQIRQEMGLCPCECIGFLDDTRKTLEDFGDYPPVLGVIAEEAVPRDVSLVLAIGKPERRLQVIKQLHKILDRFPNVDLGIKSREYGGVSPAARGIKMGFGNFFTENVSMLSHVTLGNFNYFNGQSIVGHNVVIGNNCEITAHSFIGGYVTLGNGVYLGPGCVVAAGYRIGDWSKISTNSTVQKDIPPNSYVVGVPGKVYKNFFPAPADADWLPK